MREIVKADQPFVRDELDRRRRARAVRRPAVQARDHRAGRRRGAADADDAGEVGGDGDASACTATSATATSSSSTCAAARTCRRPSRLGAFKLTQGRRRVLARRREAPDAAAHLRHRVGVEGRARRAPAPARGGREARPPQARRRARPVLVPRGDRLGPRGVPPEGRRSSAASWRTTRASATRQAGYEFVNSPHITKAELFETSGHLDWFADGMFPPMELDGGHRVLPQADELPVPHPDLPQPAALVPRAAAAAASSSARCTATRSRAWCTASPACAA